MRDALFCIACVLASILLLYWVDIGKCIDQDLGLYKKHHGVHCAIKK
jgi:hypothetical protein